MRWPKTPRRLRIATMLAMLLVTSGSPVVAEAASKRPAVVQTQVIGKSVQGRNIQAFRIGDPRSPRKVVMLASMHGNERGPSRILANLRDGRPVRGADIWLVPVSNPDGFVRNRRQNARGVDLNRNFSRNWSRLTGAYHSGAGPASEPETKAVMGFLTKVRPAYVVSFHQPLRGIGRTAPKGAAFVKRLNRGMRLPVRSFNCSSVCRGTMTEWFNASFPGVAVTVEYGRGVSRKQATRTGPTGVLRAVGAYR